MHANRELLERILDNKASSWAGVAVVLPLFLAVIFLGSISFSVAKFTAPLVEKILAPPQVQQQERLRFEESLPSKRLEQVFLNIDRAENGEATIPSPTTEDDMPTLVPVRMPARADVAMSELPENQPGWKQETPNVGVNPAALLDPSARIEPDVLSDEETTLRQGQSQRPTAAGDDGPRLAVNGGAALVNDRSGNIQADPALTKPVVITSQSPEPSAGVGISKPATAEKQSLTDWILQHQAPLRPAIQEALGYSELKADRTSTGFVVDESGKMYQLFFLHRIENNLLRILVVDQEKAYRIDLPDFYLEANHVRTGRVSRGPSPADSFNPGPIIEVALESVSAIPAEVPFIFDLVLRWLEIKGQE